MIERPPAQFQDRFLSMFPDEKGTNYVKNVSIVVTEQCNMRCSYCYQHGKNDSRLSYETAQRIADIILCDVESGAVILDFIGGEPMLEMDVIEYFMTYFLRRALQMEHKFAVNYMISMSSNGTLYHKPEFQRFLRKYKERLSLGITVDGNKELHDACRRFVDGSPTYDIVSKNAVDYLKLNPNATTKLTLAPANIRYLCDAVKNLHELGYKYVNANCVFEEGWTEEHAQILYEQMCRLGEYLRDKDMYCSLFDRSIGRPLSKEDNQNWCGGTGKMLSFTPDGGIQPCIRYAGYSLREGRKEIRVGDTQHGLFKTEEEICYMNMLCGITRRSQSTDECFNCEVASGCAWCSAYNYEVNGSPDIRATFICPMHKARVRACREYWNE